MRVKNFRNLGDVTVSFKESPIITLVGENEAGKTSLIKAFSMCALHDSPRDQKDYIRDGTNMLGVEINLEDGTQVVRVKERSGMNMYRVIKPDGQVYDTTKITDGLPAQVEKEMGLITEPETGEYLHVRTYEDKLLFVVTPSSTNYKVMYNALKVEQLTKAIKLGSTEANTLKAEISRNDASIQTLHGQLRQIKVIDTEPLVSIKDRLIKQLSALDKLEKLKLLINQLEIKQKQLGAMALIDIYGLVTIDEVLASRVNNINRLVSSRNDLVRKRDIFTDLSNIGEIDTSVLEKLEYLSSKRDILNGKKSVAVMLTPVISLSEISESNAIQINKIASLLDRLNTLKNTVTVIDVSGCKAIEQSDIDSLHKAEKVTQLIASVNGKKAELKQYTDYIAQVEAYLKQCGVAVETCSKCGEAVIFDISKL